MLLLVLGLVVFFGIHLAPVTGTRTVLVERFGAGPYKILFAVVSLAGLALVVYGYDAARAAGPMVVWEPPAAMRHVAALLLLPVFPLLIAAYRPGRIRATLKHPMLVAVKLWAVAHLLSNGTLPDILLFGAFLAYAVVDRISLKRRGVANPPPSGWTGGDAIALVGGLLLYGLLAWRLHLWLIGVSPFGG